MVPMRSLGQDGWKIAAALMGRHIGGGKSIDSCLLCGLIQFFFPDHPSIHVFPSHLYANFFFNNFHGKMPYTVILEFL